MPLRIIHAIYVCFLIAAVHADRPFLPASQPDESELSAPEIIQNRGYPVEIHEVTTSDGYVLTMHRIPHGKGQTQTPNRNVAYLQHGILSSSIDFIIADVKHSLAYILADAGYDVWMGNARGNTYSRKHKKLDPNKSRFWNFSWHEIGVIDVPAMIDYALAFSGQKTLFHVGHSQGTTTFYVMCSERPEYNDKIKAQFSLAPIAYMKHSHNPFLKIIARGTELLEIVTKGLGLGEFLPESKLTKFIGKHICNRDRLSQKLCANGLFLLCGFNEKQLNYSLLPTILSHTPAGSSTKQIIHYGQGIISGKFRQYDYGFLKNIFTYGSVTPPDYKLENVKAPVHLIHSRNDWLSHDIDVDQLYREVKHGHKYLVKDPNWNHLDYLYGIDAKSQVYNYILKVMKAYERKKPFYVWNFNKDDFKFLL